MAERQRKRAARPGAITSEENNPWANLPTWEPTPEEQKAWEGMLANMPIWEEIINKSPVKGKEKEENNEK